MEIATDTQWKFMCPLTKNRRASGDLTPCPFLKF